MRKVFKPPSEDILRKKYLDEQKPMHTIADELGVSITTVFNYMKSYGIPSRSKEETFTMKGRKLSKEQCDRISKMHKGKIVSAETRAKMSQSAKDGGIGHKKKRADGYIAVYFPDHPKSSNTGYIMEHVLVMEALLGRHLNEDECVHHINEKKDDNRKENLKLMTKSEHMSLHMKERHARKKG